MRLRVEVAEHRVPTLFGSAICVEAGGLIAYGTNNAEMIRRSASYVDRILKGAKPCDPPIEMPSDYQLVVNLKTAKSMGLTIPQAILLRASRVIE